MKELVYHRTFLPAIERNADKVAIVDGDYTETYAEHVDRVCGSRTRMHRQLGVEPRRLASR